MNTGARIAALRAKAGISQNALARRIGVSSGMTISLWETGTYKPSTEHAIKLADFFGVTVGDLWGDSHAQTVTAPTEAAQ